MNLKVPVKNKNLLIRTREDDMLLLDLRRDDVYFRIDKMAFQTWSFIDDKSTVQQIVEKMASATQYSLTDVKPFVTSFFKDLSKNKLISWKTKK